MAISRKPKAKQAYSYLLRVEIEDTTPILAVCGSAEAILYARSGMALIFLA